MFSLEDMYRSIGGGSCYAPVDLAECSRLDLSSLMTVRGLGTVGRSLGLYATHVPELRAPVVGEGGKHGAVREHSDPGRRGMGGHMIKG